MTEPLMAGTDDLAARIRRGESEAFQELFEQFYESLVGYAYTLLHSVDASRDVVCEVYSAIWAVHTSWHPTEGTRPYLFRAVRNRCLNVIRDEARRQAAARGDPDVLPLPRAMGIGIDEELEREARWLAVKRAIAAMSGLRGEAMRLRWVDKLSQAEVAQVLGISLNAVQQHLSIALRDLRKQFEEKGGFNVS